MNRRSKKQRRARQRELEQRNGNADKSHANRAKPEIETPRRRKPKRRAKKAPGPLTKVAGEYAIYIKLYLVWFSAYLVFLVISNPTDWSLGRIIFAIIVAPLIPWGICATMYFIRARACPICGKTMLKRESHSSDRASPDGRQVADNTYWDPNAGDGSGGWVNIVFFHLCRNCDIELFPRELNAWKDVETEEETETIDDVRAFVEARLGDFIAIDWLTSRPD